MRESYIKYESGRFWVCANKNSYSVMIAKSTHSESESAYAKNDDGFSLAVARCKYLANRDTEFRKRLT